MAWQFRILVFIMYYFPSLLPAKVQLESSIFSKIIPLQLSKDFSGSPGILTLGKTATCFKVLFANRPLVKP